MSIYSNIMQQLTAYGARLVAVSKTRTVAEIMALYQQGQRLFGENKVQELMEKIPLLPDDIEWHLIGHLQSNKIKFIIPHIQLIHSVDSLKLLTEINKESAKKQVVQKVLIQVHIAAEESKFGVDKEELIEIMEYYTAPAAPFKNIEIAGLMGMATNTKDESIVALEFHQLRELFSFIKNTYLLHKSSFKELSMGMSNDYTIALKYGSTMVRIGSLLFDQDPSARHFRDK